ncbi:hypothetical protein CQ12_11045 [Bradyrhizobium jicamae]|uniref:Uncharacterized protein n=1 Tax=Bradyrhizobium jicamae TaxID=280332 RepID=A0A0R3M3Y2_9BRAD|nr:hypothetical protein [Bradyrhizobium jicamae]KRR14657.1 hypothetical protein CQ12_11045 [Bradyrhizobium jicamae]
MADITNILQKLDAIMAARTTKDEAMTLVIEALRTLNGGNPSTIKAEPDPVDGTARQNIKVKLRRK